MKLINCVLLYNLQRLAPDASKKENILEADFDSSETIDALKESLKKISKNVKLLEADINATKYLINNRKNIDLAFIYTVGFNGEDHYLHFPAICEMLSIPYTGQTPLVQGILANKLALKKHLKSIGVKTPNSYNKSEISSFKKNTKLKFPLIFKPTAFGSSAGMTRESVVYNFDQLQKTKKKFDRIFEDFFLEEFLEGREFSISIIGAKPVILPIVELDYKTFPSNYPKFASYEIKNETVKIDGSFAKCPADINKSTIKKLNDLALNIWRNLGLRDWARIDVRMDSNFTANVLDINCPASLEPHGLEKGYCSMTKSAFTFGWNHDRLISEIVRSALSRYKT